jgi:hypothetical protein
LNLGHWDLPFDLAQGGESFDSAQDRESIDFAQDREPVERPVEPFVICILVLEIFIIFIWLSVLFSFEKHLQTEQGRYEC